MRYLACSVLVVLAACTDFEPVTRDVCGNGLLEAGEDCDSSDARCVSCAVTCSSSTDCPTTDYACGVDGVCHAPGGALGQLRAVGTFQADDMRITDVDHDGIGDALGLSRTSLIVRHGDAGGELDEVDSILTPTQTGPAAFGDLDADGSLDLALTTPDGLVSYASPYGELAPVAVDSALVDADSGDPLDILMFFFVSSNVFTGVVNDPATNRIALISVDSTAPVGAPPFVVQLPCPTRGPITSSDFDPSRVEVYSVNSDSQGRIDAIVSISTGSGANRKYCVVAVRRGPPQFLQPYPQFTFNDVTPTGVGSPVKRTVLADLDDDSDPCPGLVKSDAGLGALQYWDAYQPSANAECLFVGTPTALAAMDAPMGAELVGRAPVIPRVPFVAADGLITTEGLYPFLPAGIPILAPAPFFSVVYRTTRKIAHIGHGDIDGDGGIDIVIGAAGEENLDALLRVKAEAGFNLIRLDTASTVTSITIGDFDANNISDIAYTEALEDHERLLVAYGTPDRPLDAIAVGVFAGVSVVSRIGFPDSVDYLGLADDLAVLQPPSPGSVEPRATLLHGSPQRTLLSYFDPRLESQRQDTLFKGSVIGHFASSTTATEYSDLVAIAPPSARSTTPMAVKAWRVPGTADGLDGTANAGVDVQGVADCSLAAGTSLCLDVARYVAFPTGENHDVVIGIDRGQRAVMFDPWSTGASVPSVSLAQLVAKIPERTLPRSLYAADIDGDGSAELIATLAPGPASGATGAVLVCTMQNGVPQQCDDLVPAIQEAASAAGFDVGQCYDAAPGRMSYRDPTIEPTGGSDIVVACRGEGTSLFRVQRSRDGDVVDRLTTVSGAISTLRVGDVNGDGVDDLVMLEGETVTSLVVYTQCTSRDAACVAGDK